MFRHAEDRVPVAVFFAVTTIDLLLYATVENVWALGAYALVMVLPKGTLGAWSHHHQHNPTFRGTPLNRLLELCFAFHTGITTNLWVLHHVLGHHLNYLDQTMDESRWRRRDGTQMGMLEYSLRVACTGYYRGFMVGRRYPKQRQSFLMWTAVTLVLLAVLLWYRPLQGALLFLLPMLYGPLFTAWVTYDHHAGLDTDNPYEASFNITSKWFNVVTGNLGYHTAHHHRQALHWSRLPELHAQIEDRIPKHLYRLSTFGVRIGTRRERGRGTAVGSGRA